MNHGYRALFGAQLARVEHHWLYRLLAWALTFCAVVVAWVLFRAADFATVATLLRAMIGQGAPVSDFGDSLMLWNAGFSVRGALAHCLVLGMSAALSPNSNVLGACVLTLYRRRPDGRWLGLGAAHLWCDFLVVVNLGS